MAGKPPNVTMTIMFIGDAVVPADFSADVWATCSDGTFVESLADMEACHDSMDFAKGLGIDASLAPWICSLQNKLQGAGSLLLAPWSAFNTASTGPHTTHIHTVFAALTVTIAAHNTDHGLAPLQHSFTTAVRHQYCYDL
ncbi:hypothetical protein I306_00447 [Cryptococcus gattii EJB2]|uniref:Uncharacterized protein n=1 Tax=Cryptococcus gattii EJB2 TaxID=1296103 RepID=A0ABR5C3H9_9TREE|nr:hypothetical protein I306_00447 [Cryptococcus gattii EJB2]